MGHQLISIQKHSLARLLRNVDRGRFAIPKLQREFVWDGPKAAKLLDSILRRMPIGVVMVWETPRNQRLYLRQNYHVLPPFNAKNSKVWFLIDGQQRVSVIHHVREGTDLKNARGTTVAFQRVVLSLHPEQDGQQIRYRKPVKGSYEPLTDVLHPHWQSKLSHLGPAKRKRVRQARQYILNYPMHFMFVTGALEQIRESFLRINTQGMKITTADAIFTRAEELDLRDIRHEVRQHVDDQFGEIPEMPILFALAAVRGGTEARGRALLSVIKGLEHDARSDAKLRKKLAREWHRLAKCFGKAVDYLRQHFRVLTRDYLYSDYMVSILALFYYWNGRGPSTRQKEQINKWFWATSVGSRYSGRNFLRCLPSDAKFFKALAQTRNARFKYQPDVDTSDVRKSQYASRTGVTTAFYCMLLRKRPVSIVDDALTEIPLDRYATIANRKNRHHIFPRATLANAQVSAGLYNSICNICLLTAEENQAIGMRRPSSYLGDVYWDGKYFAKKMNRHLIPDHDESGIWQKDLKKGFTRFIRQRAETICRQLEWEAGIRLFRRDEANR